MLLSLFTAFVLFAHGESICVETLPGSKIFYGKGEKEIIGETSARLIKRIRLKKSKQKMYYIKYAGRKGAVPAKKARLVKRQECGTRPVTAVRTLVAKRRNRYGFEFGYSNFLDTTPIEGLEFSRFKFPLTDANAINFPFPNNGVPVPDPFVDSISDGQSFSLNIFWEHKWTHRIKQKWGLGYSQRTFTLETYTNPGNVFITPENLTRADRDLTFRSAYFRPEVGWVYWRGKNWTWSLNVGVQLEYLLEEVDFEVRIGSNDTEPVVVQAGYDQFNPSYFIRLLDIEYSNLRLGLDFFDPQDGLSPVVSVAYVY